MRICNRSKAHYQVYERRRGGGGGGGRKDKDIHKSVITLTQISVEDGKKLSRCINQFI